LPERRTIVGNNENSLPRRRCCERGTKGREVGGVAAQELYVRTVAAREASQLFDVEPALLHLGERYAAVEQLFAEPPPRAFPQASGIDAESVESHDQGPEAAERRIGLGVELFSESEISLQPTGRECLGENLATVER
jgi:hypothetical protein